MRTSAVIGLIAVLTWSATLAAGAGRAHPSDYRLDLGLPLLWLGPAVPETGAARPPLLIVLHDRGQAPWRMAGDFGCLTAHFRLACPSGPLPAIEESAGGRAWRLPLLPDLDRAYFEAVEQGLLALIDGPGAGTEFDPRRVYLVGCGEGATLALTIALRRPDRFAGVASYEGGLILDRLTGVPPAASALQVLLLSGAPAPESPPPALESVRVRLADLGIADVAVRLYPASGAFRPEMAGDVLAWLRPRRLDPAAGLDPDLVAGVRAGRNGPLLRRLGRPSVPGGEQLAGLRLLAGSRGPDPAVAERLLELAGARATLEIRLAAIETLGARGETGATAGLIALLGDRSAPIEVRRAAFAALARIPDAGGWESWRRAPRRLRITAVDPDGPGAVMKLRPGGFLHRYDGADLSTLADLRRLVQIGVERSAPPVAVLASDDGAISETLFNRGDLGLALEEVLR